MPGELGKALHLKSTDHTTTTLIYFHPNVFSFLHYDFAISLSLNAGHTAHLQYIW